MANLRIYNGDAIGQNTLSADWLRRRLASGAEGCGFDPRLAYQPSQRSKSADWQISYGSASLLNCRTGSP